MEYGIEISVQVGRSVTPEVFEALFDRVSDEFFELDAVHDQDVAGNVADATLTFSMTVSANDEVEALPIAMAAVRTAIHASEGSTSTWDKDIETLHTMIARERTLAAAH